MQIVGRAARLVSPAVKKYQAEHSTEGEMLRYVIVGRPAGGSVRVGNRFAYCFAGFGTVFFASVVPPGGSLWISLLLGLAGAVGVAAAEYLISLGGGGLKRGFIGVAITNQRLIFARLKSSRRPIEFRERPRSDVQRGIVESGGRHGLSTVTLSGDSWSETIELPGIGDDVIRRVQSELADWPGDETGAQPGVASW